MGTHGTLFRTHRSVIEIPGIGIGFDPQTTLEAEILRGIDIPLNKTIIKFQYVK